MLNGIEVRGIGGKEYQLAHCLIFNQGPNLSGMVDIAVVEYEHTSRPRIGISEGNDEFLKELNKALCGD